MCSGKDAVSLLGTNYIANAHRWMSEGLEHHRTHGFFSFIKPLSTGFHAFKAPELLV